MTLGDTLFPAVRKVGKYHLLLNINENRQAIRSLKWKFYIGYILETIVMLLEHVGSLVGMTRHRRRRRVLANNRAQSRLEQNWLLLTLKELQRAREVNRVLVGWKYYFQLNFHERVDRSHLDRLLLMQHLYESLISSKMSKGKRRLCNELEKLTILSRMRFILELFLVPK